MHKFTVIAVAALCLVGTAVAAQPSADAWEIGPVIRGRNYSIGMPATMQPGPQGPWFAFPERGRGEVHYVTIQTGPLEGAQKITLRYKVDARPGVQFIAQESQGQGKLGLALHRAGDNWSAKGRYEAYRWYSPVFVPIEPGVHTITVRFDDPSWGAVMTSSARTNPGAFGAALAETEAVSLTFGGDGGRGHGVYATGPARFTVLDFRIE